MRKSLLLIVTTIFSGCMGGMDAMNDNFSFSIDRSFVVNSNSQTAYEVIDTFDAVEVNTEFSKNRSFVKSLAMRSLSCSVTAVEGSSTQNTISGTLSIGGAGHDAKVFARFENVTMQSMMNDMHGMMMDPGGTRMFEDMMMDPSGMTMMYFNCNGDRDSMRFTMQFHFEMMAQCSNMGMMN